MAALVDEVREPGGYADPWDGTQVSSGFQTPRMKTGGCTETTKVLLMKERKAAGQFAPDRQEGMTNNTRFDHVTPLPQES